MIHTGLFSVLTKNNTSIQCRTNGNCTFALILNKYTMEKAVKVRVLLDSKEKQDVFRDIEIKTSQNLEDLHHAIIDSVGFKSNEPASFYLSNEDWTREREIPLMDMGAEPGKDTTCMKDTLIGEVMVQKKQKFIYIFDYFRMWTFLVEVEEINPIEKDETYPRITLSYGEAPDQESKEPTDMFGSEPFNGEDL